MDHYLGYVEFIHGDLWGRIRPLARVKKRSADDAWIVDRGCEPEEWGSTGLVFWPKIAQDQAYLARHYVRFNVEPNQRPRDPERECDEFVVVRKWPHGLFHRVEPLGLPILPEKSVLGPDRVLASNSGVEPGSIVYRRRMRDTLIDGPWRVVASGDPPKLCLQPKEDGYVVEHEIDRLGSDDRRLLPLRLQEYLRERAPGRLGSETYHVWDDEDEIQAVLLVEPAPEAGRLIDLLPASGLAGWLIRMLTGDKSLLSSLDRASPGWRGRVGELLGTAPEPVQRTLDQNRFAHLEATLDALADDEAQLAKLVELPRFKEVLDAAIGREVVSARGRIEAAAAEETRDFVNRLKQERGEAKERAERKKQDLLREVDRICVEVADAERLRAESRVQAERDKSSIRAAADYLIESRERIIRDFSAFHGLIESARASGDVSANGHSPAVTKLLEAPPSTRTEVMPEGPAIDKPWVFIRDRLAPAMASWGTEATELQAKRLHAALLACRWVAAPCPSWGVAYAEAMGAHAQYRVVAVEPTWLSFSDAWGGEVGAFWREAIERREALHLLIFADADRSLVQCWARPLLDMISGLRPALPGGLPWPENLRVMACPSADEAALPVPDWVVAHWAGVGSSRGTRPDQPIVPGHVPFAAWSQWIMPSDDASRPSVGIGVAARAAAFERSALARTLQRLDPDEDPEAAEEVAREVREGAARSVFAREAPG
jgi:hypothetical protein